ncbi:MAG: Holliday junction branch migration protein RuvA [Clostridia bacterium]|nr:Holliday junction branch migration protein RuvA [Clostridia bacterium]
MIYTLRGLLTETDITGSAIVIECGGVGYRLTATANAIASLPSLNYGPDGEVRSYDEVKVYTYMAVKEDGVELFAFKDKEELDTFKLLISVQGVGPKAAMSILSLFTPGKLAFVIASEDTKSISRAPGIGAKTAARVVLELKDKMAKAFPDYGVSSFKEEAKPKSSAAADKTKLKDAQDALAVLGYSRSEIAAAMKNADLTSSVEDIIKESLAALMKQ